MPRSCTKSGARIARSILRKSVIRTPWGADQGEKWVPSGLVAVTTDVIQLGIRRNFLPLAPLPRRSRI